MPNIAFFSKSAFPVWQTSYIMTPISGFPGRKSVIPKQWPFDLVPASCSHICLNITSTSPLLPSWHTNKLFPTSFQRVLNAIKSRTKKVSNRVRLTRLSEVCPSSYPSHKIPMFVSDHLGCRCVDRHLKQDPDLVSRRKILCGIIWKNQWFSEWCDF